MRYKYLINWAEHKYVWDDNDEDNNVIIQNKYKVGFFTDQELEDFCNKNCKSGCAVTFLGQVQENSKYSPGIMPDK